MKAMVEAWLKWCKGLHRKKEILGLAARLEITPPHAAGLCMIFWEWLDDNAGDIRLDENGNATFPIGSLSLQSIDRLLGVDGFSTALVAEGWLIFQNGELIVPNFSRHNLTIGKQRAQNRERVRRHRRALIKKEKKKNSISTADDRSVLTFACAGPPGIWRLQPDHLTELQALFPTLDVLTECRKAAAWIAADPARRKTSRGMPRFLIGWLNKAIVFREKRYAPQNAIKRVHRNRYHFDERNNRVLLLPEKKPASYDGQTLPHSFALPAAMGKNS